MVVPQAALIQSARGTIVYLVEDGKAVLRPVKQVGGQSGEAAITGIAAGDTVVVEGKQNLRPGSLVVERAKEPKAGASSPAAGASGATGATPAATASRTAP